MDKESLRFDLDNLVKLYVDLEKQMIKFDEIVPYDRQTTAKIFSPRLLNMMLVCCPQIEAVTKLVASRCDIKTKSNSTPSLIHKINEKAVLSDFQIHLIPSNLQFTPFTKHLEWWNAYNALKHGLSENQSKINYATVLNAFAALAALHCLADKLMIVFDKDIPNVLDRKHWIHEEKILRIFLSNKLDPQPLWKSLLFQIKNLYRTY